MKCTCEFMIIMEKCYDPCAFIDKLRLQVHMEERVHSILAIKNIRKKRKNPHYDTHKAGHTQQHRTQKERGRTLGAQP